MGLLSKESKDYDRPDDISDDDDDVIIETNKSFLETNYRATKHFNWRQLVKQIR